jgi:hypothetical protein
MAPHHNSNHVMAPCNNNFYQEQQPGIAGRMQDATQSITFGKHLFQCNMFHLKITWTIICNKTKRIPVVCFSESEAESQEQEKIREIAAQETQCTIVNLYNSHSCLPCPQAVGNEKNNACHYIDCLLCNTKTRKNVHAFHIMQRALFASSSFSLQAIYDTFYAENPLTNSDSFAELHNEFQLVHRDLVPRSSIIAATIQKQRSSIPLKGLFDPGLDLTFIHERCIPNGATPVVSLTTTGTTLAGTFTISSFVTLEKLLLPEFH